MKNIEIQDLDKGLQLLLADEMSEKSNKYWSLLQKRNFLKTKFYK